MVKRIKIKERKVGRRNKTFLYKKQQAYMPFYILCTIHFNKTAFVISSDTYIANMIG